MVPVPFYGIAAALRDRRPAVRSRHGRDDNRVLFPTFFRQWSCIVMPCHTLTATGAVFGLN